MKWQSWMLWAAVGWLGCMGFESCANGTPPRSALQYPVGTLVAEPTLQGHLADMEVAYLAEMAAADRYAAGARQANTEGLRTIGLLFEAAATSERIHGTNHLAVLRAAGKSVADPSAQDWTGSTRHHLQVATQSESQEVEARYPAYLVTARAVGAEMGAQSLQYALKSETQHLALLEAASEALASGSEATLPQVYFVCPTCGRLYWDELPQRCAVSITDARWFVRIGGHHL